MDNRRVVVTGFGVISCVGNNVPDFWDALISGRCGIGEITRFDASEYRTRIAGEVKGFDFSGYMSPKDAKRLDLFCQYAIAAADVAMEAAPTKNNTFSTGLFRPQPRMSFRFREWVPK